MFTQLDLCSVSGRVVPRLNNVWEKNDLVYLLKASLQTVVATISFNVHVCYFSRILASMLFCFCPRKNFNVSFHFFSYYFKTCGHFQNPILFFFLCSQLYWEWGDRNKSALQIPPGHSRFKDCVFFILFQLKVALQLALAETITKTKEEKVERRQHCE